MISQRPLPIEKNQAARHREKSRTNHGKIKTHIIEVELLGVSSKDFVGLLDFRVVTMNPRYLFINVNLPGSAGIRQSNHAGLPTLQIHSTNPILRMVAYVALFI